MRPLDKGPIQGPFIEYQEARDPLIGVLGEYCCYCERPSDLHVEHVEPKALPHYHSRLLDWTNFLLACHICNRMKTNIDPRLSTYYFPHEVNTAYAFRYDEASNKVLSNFDPQTHPNEHAAAERTINDLLELNRLLDSMGRIDKRWRLRQEAWQIATETRASHIANLPISQKDIESIRMMARQTGFFTIWLTVFKNEPNVCCDLINSCLILPVPPSLIRYFAGTRRRCYDPTTGQALADLNL